MNQQAITVYITKEDDICMYQLVWDDNKFRVDQTQEQYDKIISKRRHRRLKQYYMILNRAFDGLIPTELCIESGFYYGEDHPKNKYFLFTENEIGRLGPNWVEILFGKER